MKHLRKFGLAGAMALVAICGVVGSASATTIDPASTAVTLTSTNSALAVTGAGISVTCQHSTISGVTPASGGTTWATIPNGTLSYANCSAISPATVNQAPACHTTARPILHVMGVASPANAAAVVTLPVGCNIDVDINNGASPHCTLTVTGGQTIGNGTSGAGGIAWTNLSPKSAADLNAATVSNIHSNGSGFLCPSAGVHTGSLSGVYAVASATNVTVTP